MIQILKHSHEENPKTKILGIQRFAFPGGEVSVKLNTNDYAYKAFDAKSQFIVARIQSSQDFMELAMATDALRRFDPTPIKLLMPYFPYARQDRVCVKGESFSVKVFANLINSLGFEQVIICDPHSDVTPALIDNVKVYSQFDLVNMNQGLIVRTMTAGALISPDAGANKKTSELAKFFNRTDFVRADKLRNLETGQIVETIVYKDDFAGLDVICFDDICDGGFSFIQLAKACKAKNCGKFILYVTHGIFSKGLCVLSEGGVDEIYTTNSFNDTWIGKSVNTFDVVNKIINE